jgi:hypothetical protein
MTTLFAGAAAWWAGLNPVAKRWVAIAVIAIAFGWVMFSWGGEAARDEIARQQQVAAKRVVKITTRAQDNLDGETARIGAEAERNEARAVQIVERVKTEVRYEMAKEADPRERLRIWRDGARKLRDDLATQRESLPDGKDPAKGASTLRGSGAP